jgi:glycosyltransferase involved in cell wall biosynthesis
MAADLRAKRAALRRAGATLAVSEAIATELRQAGLPRVEVLPNVVDADEVREVARTPPSVPLPDRFLLFVGKLEENKGARLLVPAVARAATGLPLVVLGEGSLAHAL